MYVYIYIYLFIYIHISSHTTRYFGSLAIIRDNIKITGIFSRS